MLQTLKKLKITDSYTQNILVLGCSRIDIMKPEQCRNLRCILRILRGGSQHLQLT